MSLKHTEPAFTSPTRASAMFVENPTDLPEGQEACLLVNKAGELRVDISGGVTIGSLSIIGTTRTIKRLPISAALLGDNPIIPAPGAGLTTKIIKLVYQNTSGSSVTVIYKDGATAINGLGFVHANGEGIFDEAPGGPGFAELILSVDTAFILNLSGTKQISGYVIFRDD